MLTFVRNCANLFIYYHISFLQQSHERNIFNFHFTDEETEIQRGLVTYPSNTARKCWS